MNPVKKILGHIYFVYGMLVFMITMIVIALIPASIALLFKEPRRAKIVHPTYRFWMGVFLPLVFIRVKRKGAELFTKGENFVVVVNHNSLVDIPVSMPWVPGPNKTLAKIEMSKIPLFGIIYKAGSILLDRKNANSKKESVLEMQKTLVEDGLHLTLYPEGTRNKSDQPLLPFHDGAFSTAIKAEKTIIAGVIFNAKNILPHDIKLWAWPHTIHFHFINVYPTNDLDLHNVAQLKEEIRTDMAHYFVAHKDQLA